MLKCLRQHAADLNHAGPVSACMLWRSMVRRSRVVSITQRRQGKTGAQRVCCQHGFGSGAYRDRRKIKRDPGVQKTAGRTRRCGPYRHVRCDALSKKPSKPPPRERTSDRSTQRQSADLASEGGSRLRHDHSTFLVFGPLMKNAAIATKREPSPCSTQRPPSLGRNGSLMSPPSFKSNASSMHSNPPPAFGGHQPKHHSICATA